MNNINQSYIPPGMLERIIHNKQMVIVYYEELLKITSDPLNLEFIRAIHLDETKHLSNFINLFNNLYDSQPNLANPEFMQIDSFIDGVKNSIKSELALYDNYSNIFFTDSNDSVRKTFFQALTDENQHASKFNFIYSKLLESKLT